jgi:hypothetical protein
MPRSPAINSSRSMVSISRRCGYAAKFDEHHPHSKLSDEPVLFQTTDASCHSFVHARCCTFVKMQFNSTHSVNADVIAECDTVVPRVAKSVDV